MLSTEETVGEVVMSFGAHLLLWGFPLLLTVAVVFSAVRGARPEGRER
jgi:cytochrome c-type biogenesis protein CcmH/NrfF